MPVPDLVPGWRARDLEVLEVLGDTFVPGIDSKDIARRAAVALSLSIDAAQVRQLRWVLRAFDSRAVCLALTGRATRFVDRDRDAREAFLRDWGTSRIAQRRAAFTAWRKLLTSLALAVPSAEGRNRVMTTTGPGYRPDDPPVTGDRTPIRPYQLPAATGPGDEVALDADIVIIGSGAGGGVIAAALAEAGRSVVVLESGPFVSEPDMPRDELTGFDRLYLAHGLSATWDGSFTLLAGSAVGGGTLVNWTTTLPPGDAVRHEWSTEHGLQSVVGPEWDADVEALTAELQVRPATSMPPKDAAIMRGAEALGWRAMALPRNSSGCDDCGSCVFGCVRGTKQSGIRVHLARAAAAGARIVPEAHARRIIIEDGRAVGVEAVVGREAWRRARLEGWPDPPRPRSFVVRAQQVVVAAGALRTPVVLARSGLDHPAIGANLRIHPVPFVVGRYDQPIEMWRGIMQAATMTEFADDVPGRRGYVIESAPGHPALGAVAVPWESGAGFRSMVDAFPFLAPLIAVIRDGGTGTVRPTRDRGVRIDYRLDDDGRATVLHALGTMTRLARAAGASEIIVPTMSRSPLVVSADGDEAAFERSVTTLARIDLGPNRLGLFSAHQMGTARAGSDPRRHACDPGGRVRAGARSDAVVRGLYVGDGSLCPTGVGVNPMLTIMALARGVARTVQADG